jgi:DNA-directed RNA polymerase specialized sigma24 family protein
MEHLGRELARLAWQLERDAADLAEWANRSNRSDESPVAASLGRIEARLGSVHEHTSELLRRVPVELDKAIGDLRQALLVRLDEATQANGSAESQDQPEATRATETTQSTHAAIRALTPQERRVFQVCFQSGLLSYRDIAEHLDITPTAAKNLVNRVFQAAHKRPLFVKRYDHGAVRVGVQPDLQRRILGGSKTEGNRTRPPVVQSTSGFAARTRRPP